jgi:hypothetical protein
MENSLVVPSRVRSAASMTKRTVANDGIDASARR